MYINTNIIYINMNSHLSRLNTSQWMDRRRRRGTGGRGRREAAAEASGNSGGVYLIFGTRWFVECHLNSELIIHQANRPSGARPAAAVTASPRRSCVRRATSRRGATAVQQRGAQLNFFNLFPRAQGRIRLINIRFPYCFIFIFHFSFY